MIGRIGGGCLSLGCVIGRIEGGCLSLGCVRCVIERIGGGGGGSDRNVPIQTNNQTLHQYVAMCLFLVVKGW